MKITFISNYFNHHQKFVSDVLNDLCCQQYLFVETTQMREERKKLGYEQKKIPSYVVSSYMMDKKKDYLFEEVGKSDVVIWGSCSNRWIKQRLKDGTLTFAYSERIMKSKSLLKFVVRAIKYNIKFKKNQNNQYLLCSSAYTSKDYNAIGLFKGKCYKWGYFPECKKYSDIQELLNKKKKSEILWCGRFLEWKHPDDVISVAIKLKKSGYLFHISMIGEGELKEKLNKLVKDNELEKYVDIIDPQSPQKIREYMENSGIYLCTSDYHEGWGAVLNEAMNSGCAVIASHAMGATPFLIKNRINGYVYESGNIDELSTYIKILLDSSEKQEKIGKLAYETIVKEWNSEIAAKRLFDLSNNILVGKDVSNLYKTGPCSEAKIIKNDWYKN